jgi:hypothetical protein
LIRAGQSRRMCVIVKSDCWQNMHRGLSSWLRRYECVRVEVYVPTAIAIELLETSDPEKGEDLD